MATRSILKDVRIKDSKFGHTFAEALDKAEHVPEIRVEYKRKCSELKGSQIKEFFKDH